MLRVGNILACVCDTNEIIETFLNLLNGINRVVSGNRLGMGVCRPFYSSRKTIIPIVLDERNVLCETFERYLKCKIKSTRT